MTSTAATPAVISPDVLAAQPTRFGVRSSRLGGSDQAAPSFLQTLSLRSSQAVAASPAAIGGLDAPLFVSWPSVPATAQPAAPPPAWTGLSDASAVAGLPYGDVIAAAARKYGLDPALIAAVIQQESGFNPNDESSVGAKGLMQLMDDTAAGLGVTDSFDPAQNVDGGARFLRDMLDQFGGDLSLALAAYNAGPGAVQKYGGIPPYAETQDYVPRVLDYYRQFAGLA